MAIENAAKKTALEVILGLREFGKLCEEREQIMYDRALPDSAAISEVSAKMVEFCCDCFEDAIAEDPERQKRAVNAVKECVKEQKKNNEEFANEVPTSFWDRMFGK